MLSPLERDGLRPPRRRLPHDSLADAIPNIALELAARFARDALEERYFAWDADAFAHAWQHNLQRARGQISLALSAL